MSSFDVSSIQLNSLSEDPASLEEGQLWFNSTEKRFKVYRNGTIETVSHLDEVTTHSTDYNNPHGVSLEKARQVYSTISGTVDMNSNRILNVGSPSQPGDAINKTYADTHITDYSNPHGVSLEKARQVYNTVSGSVDMGSNKILNVGDPTLDGDAINKLYADSYVNAILVSGVPSTGQHLVFRTPNNVWVPDNGPTFSGVENAGVGGVGIYDTITNGILKLKNINTSDSFITISNDTVNKEIDIHVDNTAYQWTANRLLGVPVASGTYPLNDGVVLTYSSSLGAWRQYPTQDFSSVQVQGTIKSGIAVTADFSGAPLVATVTFVNPYSDTNYVVQLSTQANSTNGYFPNIQNITSAGFDINLRVNTSTNLVGIHWFTVWKGDAQDY